MVLGDQWRALEVLPGWTLGHVLAHVAQIADAMGNLLVVRAVRVGRAVPCKVAAMPEHAWQRPGRVLAGAEFPAAQLLDRRLVEIELHHTDLNAGYGPQQWCSTLMQMPLPE